MNPAVLGAALLAAAAAQPSAVAPTAVHRFWIQPVPSSAGEAALREAMSSSAFSGPSGRFDALRRVAETNAGTAASGLALLVAGLDALEGGRAADAIALLRHPDIEQTALVDRARMALGRGLEQSHDQRGAVEAYLAAADASAGGAVLCAALFAAADALASQPSQALPPLERALAACPGQQPRALLALGRTREAQRDPKGAAAAYERLDSEFPASGEAREGAPRLRTLSRHLPPSTSAERAGRALRRALILFEAGRNAEALAAFRKLPLSALAPEEANLARVRQGRALLAAGRQREAASLFASIKPGAPYEAEAAFQLARIEARKTRSAEAYEDVVRRFPGSEWAEEALLSLANHYQKDARDENALPYYRRLLEGFPQGRYVERATWRVGWGDYRAGRYAEAAQGFEARARARPAASLAPAFLYWAGRARRELGQAERARALFEETVRRFKRSYHGQRAREAMASLPAPPFSPWAEAPGPEAARSEIPEAQLVRIRQLLLVERLDEAAEELRLLAPAPLAQATLAWLDWRRGRLRPAINGLKRAYPDWVGEAGDRLPEEAWRILFPLEFADALREKAQEQGLDPALVAALICQESTFDAGAVSGAGARGLMQVMPPTGRTLARALGVPYRKTALHQPETSLAFGTHYLRELLDQFGGRVERALAAYNAGPHRVIAWTAGRPDVTAEEFIESIPFTETRFYVISILGAREQYRRLYALGSSGGGGGSHGASR